MKDDSKKALNEPVGALLGVRRRGVFLFQCLLWASVFGFVFVGIGYGVLMLNVVFDFAEKARHMVGWKMPVDGPDWLILMTFTLCVFIPAIFIAKIWKWYASVWNHRLEKVWPAEAVRRRLATTRPTLDTVTRSERKARTEYLRALLDSEEWKPHWPSIKEDAGLTDKDSITVSQDDYEKVSKALIAQIEKAVFDRALAVGFIVGFSRSPWMDQLTILSASFEIQLDVLSRLGKKPNCQMWRLLFKRSLSSLFLNTYLNRDDAFLVQLTIRKIAMGLEVLADLAETGAESLNDIDWDHFLNSLDLDESLEGALHTIDSGHEVGEHIVRTAGGVADALVSATTGAPVPVVSAVIGVFKGATKAGVSFAEFFLKTGATGMHSVAKFIESDGRDLLQGVVAGGMLYSHGMELAFDCLALDRAHREQLEAMNDGAIPRMAKRAGEMLLEQAGKLRSLFKDRRKKPITLLKSYLKSKVTGDDARRETDRGPNTTGDMK